MVVVYIYIHILPSICYRIYVGSTPPGPRLLACYHQDYTYIYTVYILIVRDPQEKTLNLSHDCILGVGGVDPT